MSNNLTHNIFVDYLEFKLNLLLNAFPSQGLCVHAVYLVHHSSTDSAQKFSMAPIIFTEPALWADSVSKAQWL